MRRFRTLVASGLCLVGATDARAQGVVLDDPRTSFVTVQVAETGDSGPVLSVFSDPTAAQPLPAVVFVLGYPDDALATGPLSATEHYRSWARLVAARGMAGVLYSTSEPVEDLRAVMSFLATGGAELGVDGSRLALWVGSGNGPVAVSQLLDRSRVSTRALAALYAVLPSGDGFMADELKTMSTRQGYVLPTTDPGDSLPTDLPILIVRPGNDHTVLLQLMDHFVEWGESQRAAIEVLRYEAGGHAFDSREDSDASREVVEQVLSFFATALGVSSRELGGGSF